MSIIAKIKTLKLGGFPFINSLLFMVFILGANFIALAQNISNKLEQLKNKPIYKEIISDDTSGAPKFLIYPTIAYTPETKWEIGIFNLFLFHAKRNHQNRLNEINTFTFVTTQKQYGFWLDHAIYTDKDNWFFLGKGRFQYFPLKYYGIGPNSPKKYTVVSNGSLQVRERILRKIKDNFYAGVEFDHQRIFNVSFNLDNSKTNFDFPVGASGSANTGIGLGIVYDDRKNVLNVRKGMFAELAYLEYSKLLFSDIPFRSFQYDIRYFRKGFSKNQVFAVQSNGMTNLGNVPFNQLALMGGESMMRGYYLGRFRDKTMINLQAEYRFLPLPFSKTVGAAIFASIGNVAETPGSIKLSSTKFAGGAGLKYLVFKSKDVYVRADFAFTNEGNGIYLYIGEAF